MMNSQDTFVAHSYGEHCGSWFEVCVAFWNSFEHENFFLPTSKMK